MHILIEKDSATKVPREVASLDEAREFVHRGFVVHVIGEDGALSPLPPADAAPADPAPAAAPAKKPAAKKAAPAKKAGRKR